MGDSGIVVERVGRSFGDVHAVREATFEVPRGRVTALVGPNGSGKTTLMLMLASLLVPDRGSIAIAGFDPVRDPAEVRRRLGWMPDVLGSWGNLTVRETVLVTARLHRLETGRAESRAAEVIRLTDLGDLADRPTRVLSRGQKQRLSLARALVHEPEVLILDEPASGLDPAARVALRDIVRRLAGEGAAVLVSSHVLAELEELADDAVFLTAGTTVSAEAIENARAATRDWRIRALDQRALLAALDAEGAGHRFEGDAVVVAVADAESAASLLARLVGAGVRVAAFGPLRGDLEQTFLDLQGGTR